MMFALALLLAYLLGSLSGSLLVGRLHGVDIRQSGSGNAGGTNAFRTRGWKFALAVVVIDIGKGVIAGLLPVWLAVDASQLVVAQSACVMAAVAGHTWPLFFGFRGGKGMATLLGGLVVFWPLALIVVLGVWLLVLLLTGYVGLSTIIAAAALLPLALLEPSVQPAVRLTFAVAAALFILYTHRGNIARLRAGSEHRFEKIRVLGRLIKR